MIIVSLCHFVLGCITSIKAFLAHFNQSQTQVFSIGESFNIALNITLSESWFVETVRVFIFRNAN